MDPKRLRELEGCYKKWSTEDLIRATNVDRLQYEPEAVELMEKELGSRILSEESTGKMLEELSKGLRTEELVRATAFEKDKYKPEMIEFMSKELESRKLPKEEIEKVLIKVEQKIREERSLGGWLLLFVIILTLNSIRAVLEIFTGGHPVNIFISFAIGVYGFVVLWHLVKKTKIAPSLAKIWIWLVFAANIFAWFFVLMYAPTQIVWIYLGATIILNMILVLWHFYFSRSKRVAATYNGDSQKSS